MFTSNPTRGFGLLEGFLAYRRTKIADKLIPNILRKGKILDMGCGSIPFFLLRIKFNEKYGMDSSLKLRSFDEKKINLIPSNIAKGKPLPFEDNFFEVVVLLAVLEHLEDEEAGFILSEIRRVLKKNGRFILTTPAPWAGGLLKFMSKLKLISQNEIDDHKGRNNYYKVKDFLQQVGFKKENIKSGHFEFFLNNWVYADK